MEWISSKGKMENIRPNLMISSPVPIENSKKNKTITVTQIDATNKFDYTAMTDWRSAVSGSDNSHPLVW